MKKEDLGSNKNVLLMKKYIGEVDRFVTVLKSQQSMIATLEDEEEKAKAAFGRAKEATREAKEAEHNTISLLLKFVLPGSIEIMPLFDRMDDPDEAKHGKGATDWRKEPISVLNVSALATRGLIAADIVLVGQLQDRVLKGADWWKGLEGITDAIAQAIESKLHEYIQEQTNK